MDAKILPGGIHVRGTLRASTAYPAKNLAFFRLNFVAAATSRGAAVTVAGQDRGSSASYIFTRPLNATALLPSPTSPATRGSRLQARAFVELLAVVTQIRPACTA